MWATLQWPIFPLVKVSPEAGLRLLWQSRFGWQRRHRVGDRIFLPKDGRQYVRRSAALAGGLDFRRVARFLPRCEPRLTHSRSRADCVSPRFYIALPTYG